MRCPQVPTALVLLIVSALPAGPILSNKRKIADELKSLAGLTQMRMHVAPVPTRFKDMGVRKAKIDAFLRQELEESGFRIVTDTEAPRCILRIIGEVDERFPDAVSIGTVLEIEQRVTVHRIDQDLTLTTAPFLDVYLTDKSEASRRLNERITLCVAYLANSVGRASDVG